MDRFIETLIKEKELLLQRLEEIDNSLRNFYSTNPIKDEPINSVSEKFPISGKTSQKVLWLFENVFKTGKRFTQIQNEFNVYNRSVIKLEGTVRGLKSKGKLVIVKYNKSNKLSFWGLSDWVDEKGFKDEYRPKDVPNITESVEVIK